MNLPNKLTILRMVLVPFFVATLLLSAANEPLKWVALALTIISLVTYISANKQVLAGDK